MLVALTGRLPRGVTRAFFRTRESCGGKSLFPARKRDSLTR